MYVYNVWSSNTDICYVYDHTISHSWTARTQWDTDRIDTSVSCHLVHEEETPGKNNKDQPECGRTNKSKNYVKVKDDERMLLPTLNTDYSTIRHLHYNIHTLQI